MERPKDRPSQVRQPRQRSCADLLLGERQRGSAFHCVISRSARRGDSVSSPWRERLGRRRGTTRSGRMWPGRVASPAKISRPRGARSSLKRRTAWVEDPLGSNAFLRRMSSTVGGGSPRSDLIREARCAAMMTSDPMGGLGHGARVGAQPALRADSAPRRRPVSPPFTALWQRRDDPRSSWRGTRCEPSGRVRVGMFGPRRRLSLCPAQLAHHPPDASGCQGTAR